MSELALVNGVPDNSLLLSDRGLAYGDGLFETIQVVAGKARFLSRHLARLERGCERLGIHVELSRLEGEVQQLLTAVTAELGVLKVIVTRGAGRRGYRPDPGATGNRYLQFHSLEGDQYRRMQQGVRLRLCRHRLPVNPPLAGIKHLNRLDNVIARAEWNEDWIDEGIMLDTSGLVIEGTMSNLFLVTPAGLVTPALQRCGVAGVIRGLILDKLALEVGVKTQVNDVLLGELYRAEEVFICNSLIGICPVLAIDCLNKTPGAVTRALQAALAVSH